MNQNHSLLLNQALSFQQAGDLERAETSYKAVLDADPKNASALTLLGTLYLQRGQGDDGNRRFGRNTVAFGKVPASVQKFTGHAAFQRVPESWEF